MSALTADYAEVVPKLRPGTRLLMEDVPWDEYEHLMAEINDRPGILISYDQGEMEIMVTSSKHESWKVLFAPLLVVLVEEMGLNLYSLGSMTFKLPEFVQGVEPDDCFYIHNADQVLDKEELDLTTDPGPELVIEVDLSHASLDKFPIYASLGVAEVWRYHRRSQLQFYKLVGEQYTPVTHSDIFPIVSPDVLMPFLQQGRQKGIIPMVRAFREWVRANLPKP